MEGFLNVNKPEGMTSSDVVREIKRAIRPGKIGYLGTLDPIATGVLPVGLGRATRLFQFMEGQEKEYDVVMTLGASTDTQDRTGRVTGEADPSAVTEEMVKEVMSGFVGRIEQIPPMFSAKKIGGERLYDLARQGIEVEREPIKATIYRMDFEGKEGPSVRFRVRLSTGAYVRTLCHDMGERLGVHAHMAELVRTRSGGFRIEDSIPLDDITRENIGKVRESLIPLAEGLSHLSRAVIIPHAAERLKNGMSVGVSDVIDFDRAEGTDLVRVVGKDGALLAVGAMEGPPLAGFPFAQIKPKRVLA